MSLSEAIPSELEVLRQRNTELEAELEIDRKKIVMLEAELEIGSKKIDMLEAELEIGSKKIDKLNETIGGLSSENFDLKREVANFRKEQELKNTELENRLVKVEQSSSVDEQPQDQSNNASSSAENEQGSPVVDTGFHPEQSQNVKEAKRAKLEESVVDVTPSGFSADTKTTEDEEMTAFLIEQHKKSVSEEIRQRNREKKLVAKATQLQRELANQDSISDTAYVSETVVVAPQSVIADTPQEEIPTVDSKVTRDIKPVNRYPEKSDLSRDIKPLNNVKRFSEDSSDSLPGISRETILPTKNDVNVQACSTGDPSSSIVTEFVQGLLEELLSDNDQLQTIKFSPPRTLVPGSISIKKLANSFCQANVARNKTILAKRSEITLWCLFSERFEDKVVELRSKDKKLTDQTARKQIYNEMKPYLTDVSIGYLQVMTCKARKINKLFGYRYDPVTLKKIKEQVNSKTVNERSQSHMSEDDAPAVPQGSERTDEIVHAEVASLGILEEESADVDENDIDFGLDDCLAGITEEDLGGNEVLKEVKRERVPELSSKIFDDSSEDDQNETSSSSSISDSDSDSDAKRDEESKNETPQIADEEILAAFGFSEDIRTVEGTNEPSVRSGPIDHPNHDILREEMTRSEGISVQS